MKTNRIFSVVSLFFLLSSFTLKAQKFVHPGLLHTTDDIVRLRSLIEHKDSVAFISYEKLINDLHSSSAYKKLGPFEIIARDGAYASRRTYSESDCRAAYYNALLYVINNDTLHGMKAMEIIRAYADSLKCITGDEAPLCAGLEGFLFLNACELMRHAATLLPQTSNQQPPSWAWTKQDTKNIDKMLKYVFMPIIEKFEKTPPYSVGSWGIAMNKLKIAIAVFTDDKKMYRESLDYFLGVSAFGKADNGSLPNYISLSGQCQESGSNQVHVMRGLGGMAEICEVAWNQGVDLYGELGNRLLVGYEYTSKANLGYEVPFSLWEDKTGKFSRWKVIGEGGMGQWLNVLEIAYNHYVGRKSIPMPYTSMALRHVRPEGSGNACDNPGFGSLLFYRNTPYDITTTVPGMRLIMQNEHRDYDPVAEPVIRMKGAENLTLVRTVDFWPEYWDLTPSGRKDDLYEYRPKDALSRNGFVFEVKKQETSFLVYGDLDVAKQINYCKTQLQRTFQQLKDSETGLIDTTRIITCIAPYDSIWERVDVNRDKSSNLYWKGIRALLDNQATDSLALLLNKSNTMLAQKAMVDNDSTLSRNIAWKLWLSALRCSEDKKDDSQQLAMKVADWFLQHLPYDMIPFWNFNSPIHLKVFRDACSACIAASGLLTLSQVLSTGSQQERSKAEGYRAAAVRMLIELSSDRYQSRNQKPSFLLHSVGDMSTGTQIDYSLIMADYFYVEALKRVKN